MSSSSIFQLMHQDRRDKQLFELARSYASEYMDEVAERSVFPSSKALENLTAFDQPLPEEPTPGERLLTELHEMGSPATVTSTGGRYFGFVNGSVVPAALAASWLSGSWDQNAALYVMSPVAGKLESVCQDWLVDLLGLPEETVAGLVTGTSVATLCGLAAARFSTLRRLGWDVGAQGLRNAPAIRMVVSEQAHGTVFKALALLGFGRNEVEVVPSDSEGRIDPDLVPALDDRTVLVLQAGNVNTGSFDAFGEICPRARAAGAWVHVDGAFGLWAAASSTRSYLTDGMGMADSWSVDAHKTLNAPYDCGIILCRDAEALISAMENTGSYIQRSEERDGLVFGADMSRRARSVELWATLRFLGRSGISQLVDGLCERASQFARELQERGFRVLNDVVFNQLLVAGETPEETTGVLRGVQDSGECWCGGTSWNGQPAIRVSVCSWATSEEDVTRSVEAFVEARRRHQAAQRIE